MNNFFNKVFSLGLSSVLAAGLLTAPRSLAETVTYIDIGLEITTLYRSARKVISDNQALINDPSKGDKGLSGGFVVEKTKQNYKNAAGKALDFGSNGKTKTAMLEAVAEVMESSQDLINQPGAGFKGFLPAIFARQLATNFNEKMKGKMKIKLTAPKNYVRNRANRPDKWEANIIESKFRMSDYEKGKPISENTTYKGKSAFRYILPEYYGESCLGCHGSPKGSRDITGGKKEGGKLNELGGAISLIVFK